MIEFTWKIESVDNLAKCNCCINVSDFRVMTGPTQVCVE